MSEQNTMQEQPSSGDSASAEDRFADILMGEQPEDETQEEGQQASDAGEQPEGESQGEETQQAQAEELEDVEYEGKQYKLPKELKSALMRERDYTQKTQETAEQRRMLALQSQQAQLVNQFQQYVAKDIQTLQQLDHEIARYKSVDWASLDTDSYIRTKSVLDQLKESKAEVERNIGTKKSEFDNHMAVQRTELNRKAGEYLARAIPKWGPEIQKQVAEFGLQEGFTDVELSNLSDPRAVKLMWKAMQYDALQNAKGTVAKKVNNAPPVAKPGASQNQAQNSKFAMQQALRKAKTSQQKAKIMESSIADVFLR